MVICLERDADVHMAQLMPLPLTVSCSSKIQIGFTFLVPAHPGSPGKKGIASDCRLVSVSNGHCQFDLLLFFLLLVYYFITELVNEELQLFIRAQYAVQCLQCFDTVGWASGRHLVCKKIE